MASTSTPDVMADAYWNAQLTDLEPSLFPDLTGKSSSARSELSGFHTAESILRLSKPFAAKCPRATFLSACFKVLALYTGEHDIALYYSPSPNRASRTLPHHGDLPLRIQFDIAATNSEILSEVENTLASAQRHGAPSRDVLHQLSLPSGCRLANTLAIFTNQQTTDLRLDSGSVTESHDEYDIVFEYTVDVDDAEESHSLKLHYRRSYLLFDDTPHVLRVFEEAMNFVLCDSAARFSTWKTDSELQLSTSNLRAKAMNCSHEQVVHAAFERHAKSRPEDIALDFLEVDHTRTKWTFSVLNSLANQIAHKLVEDYNVQVEDSIPICVSKSPAFYACILGVLKAGATFTPFAGSPLERRKYMVRELGSKVVLYVRGEDMTWCSGPKLFDASPIFENSDDTELVYDLSIAPLVQPSNLCYQMYTSGSTGQPKAVSIEHRNAVQTAYASRDLIPWIPESRILQQAGVTFDMCYFETFFAWATGICLCSAPDNLVYNRLTDLINEQQISLLGLTPSVALTLNPVKVPSIQWMYCIGEALPQSLVASWEGRLVNSYGPTEAAQMVTLFPVHHATKSTVIGRPFQNTSFVILERDSLEIVPILGLGELCIGGYQVGRGYFKNPEKTKRSFIQLLDQRFYRTGDLVRMLTNGTFEFVGRLDDQVKVRGQRVELGEINKALEASHRAVTRACTQILKVNETAKSQLVAFIVLEDKDGSHKNGEVQCAAEAHLTSTLPAYMIPKLFIFIDRVPLSSSGKVNLRRLTDILRDNIKPQSTLSDESGTASHATIDLLKHLFGTACGMPVHQIGLDVSIYQLGIDSISAIQIAHKLEERGFHAQASDIMSHPTIGELSSLLDNKTRSSPEEGSEKPQTFDFEAFDTDYRPQVLQALGMPGPKIKSVRPPTPLQKSMILQSLQSSGRLYFNHITYHLPTNTDLQRFLEAWNTLVFKHEILRSGFVQLNAPEYPMAMITYRAETFKVPVYSEKSNEDEIDVRQSDYTRSAVENIHQPPWQVVIAPERNKFYFSAHHALYDAQVLEILIRDLALAYDGVSLPVSPKLEPHLARLVHGTTTPIHASQRFWRTHGQRAAGTKFPLLSPLLEEDLGLFEVTKPLRASLSDLERRCRASGISIQAVAQSAWGNLLAALTGQDTVTFGTTLSGRTVEDALEVSFPMITTVPTTFDNRVSRLDGVREMMKFNADVQPHQFVPLNQVQKLMGFGGETLFDTLLTIQKRSHRLIATETVFKIMHNELTVEYPVSIELQPLETGILKISIFYQSNYMQQEQASLLIDQFQLLLERIVFDIGSTSEPTIETADPRLYSIIPASYRVLPSACSLLHHSVEKAAQENSNDTALEFVTELEAPVVKKASWTFQQLDEQGNKIAHLIRNAGVRQGSIVAMCFDKCPEAAFAMLGISKAGCTFLALDPGAPMDRKTFIMQDSQASLLLSKGSLSEALRSSFPKILLDLGAEDLTKTSYTRVQLDRPIDPQEAAYCLYTSGTTGTPKGCLVTHENVVQVFLCFEKLYAHNEQSKWLQFASYHFDVSVMEHFWSWSVGMTVVTASRDLILQDLASMISTLQITHIDLTPSLARLLSPKDIPTLAGGVFVTGGEMLRRDIIEAWGDTGAIHNAYGPTEATIGVTMYRKVPKNGRPSNIGWPFDVVGVYVTQPLNPHIPVLRGGIGELLVAGSLVTKGYLRRDELTQERFVEVAGQRCYRTGDLVRILSNGSIDFLGRTDDQIKLRGQRLEIGEINTVIKQAEEDVDDICTLVLKHPNLEKEQLVSFVSLRGRNHDGGNLSLYNTSQAQQMTLRLHTACVNKLPGYMVPTHILILNKMPLSANNKIENKQLKTLYNNTEASILQKSVGEGEQRESHPVNDRDMEKIRTVISQVLGAESVEIMPSANFYELGLDSISIISLSRALRAADYPRANPSVVMQNPTLHQLVSVISSAEPPGSDGSVKAARQKISACTHRLMGPAQSLLSTSREEIETIMPCTALQAGIISRSLESDDCLYFATFSFDLDGSVDVNRLKRACQSVCDRVAILRTRFMPTDDGYVQIVSRSIALPWIEKRVGTGEELDVELDNARQIWRNQNRYEILHPFELVVHKSSNLTVLTLHIFHALYDGNSLPLIMDAVMCEYYGKSKFDFGPSYHDCLLHGPLREVEGARDFWTSHLSALQYTRLEDLRPLSTTKAEHDTCVEHRTQPISGFEACRRTLNITHQAVIQACWTILLQDIMSGPLVLGMVVSGRSIDFEDADRVIGPLFNTIPFLLPVVQEDSWKSVMVKCHDFNSAALLYQHTPLRDIQKWTRKHHHAGSLFDTLFVFQMELSREIDEEPLWTPRGETFEADYPLSLEVEQMLDGSFNFTLACQAHMSDERSSKSVLEKLEYILIHAIDNIDELVSDKTTNNITVEHQKPELCRNGVADHREVGSDDYKEDAAIKPLSEIAQKVQKEVANLANVGTEQILASTSIFELGLDSIDAVKLSSRLKKATGVHIPVSQLMTHLTLDKIAAAIEGKDSLIERRSSSFDLERASEVLKACLKHTNLDLSTVEAVLPPTPLQEAMVADMLNSNFQRYLNFDVLKLDKTTDIERLKAAWMGVIRVCPIFRTRFMEIDDPEIDFTVAQVVVAEPKFEIDQVSLSNGDDFANTIECIRKRVMETYSERPASRLTLIRTSGDAVAQYAILTLPHAMYDGMSLGLMHDLVDKFYHGTSVEVPSYDQALANILRTSGDSALQYWRDALVETRPTHFPSQHKDTQIIHRAETTSQISLATIHSFCKQNNVTPAALCQTVWSITLAYYTRQLDVAFAQVLSGRTNEAASGVVFPTMNTVISRSILHGSRSEMAQYVQANSSAVSEHQYFPLRKMLSLTPSKNVKDLLNTLFIFQKSIRGFSNDSHRLYESIDSASNVEYPICVEAEVCADTLVWRTACEASCLDQHQTKVLLTTLDQVLDSIVKHSEKPVLIFAEDKVQICDLPFVSVSAKPAVLSSNTAEESIPDHDETWSTVEQRIRGVVADVAKLKASEVTKNASLFGMGLDSISIIKVSSLLRKQGIKLSVNDILGAQSIQKITELIRLDQPNGSHHGDQELASKRPTNANMNDTPQSDHLHGVDIKSLLSAYPLKAENIEDILPTSTGQTLLLSRWQNEGVYYSSLDFSVYRCNDVTKIKSAWARLVRRSPMLRTIFLATGLPTTPVIQVVLKEVEACFIEVDSGSDLEKAADQEPNRKSRSIKPACVLFAKKIADDKFELALKLCHALYDGFSIKMLIASFQDLMDQVTTPSVRSEYTFSNYLADVASDDAKRKFWTNYLSGTRILLLPKVDNNADVVSGREIHVVSADTLQSLGPVRTFARKHHVSIQSLLLASYSVTHALTLERHYSPAQTIQDIVIGVFMANRNTEGSDELAAPTLSFTPVRVKRPLTRSLIEIAQGIQDDMREISQDGRSQVGLWELQEWLGNGFKVDVWINLLRQWLPDTNGDDHQGVQIVTGERSESLTRYYDIHRHDEDVSNGLLLKNNTVRAAYDYPMIDLEVTVKDDNLDVGIQGPTSLLDSDEAKRVIQEVSTRLDELVNKPKA